MSIEEFTVPPETGNPNTEKLEPTNEEVDLSRGELVYKRFWQGTDMETLINEYEMSSGDFEDLAKFLLDQLQDPELARDKERYVALTRSLVGGLAGYVEKLKDTEDDNQ